ncbi:chromosome partitioning protein ParB [Salmonella enterica subsp. enterica serovar Typhimurium]|nr:chromosome partitioning protein ParB [Salmonella enterica subsp. enterica serovar Typhimurium]EFA4199755.1 chromosome partitioning protein ParB [Escherichia coli O132]HAU7754809.1 chromosome partitioning protein ParB [Salmonella enterica subsp. enterica]ECM1673747.1 chromosome partitioning protein ParB [Salmonella enterica subsp. enterica serovar Typhimurium]ECM5425544.1 chromosome partitioning protein ParB [Salmonella enterica subsp. enterica serovar Typhimurium]
MSKTATTLSAGRPSARTDKSKAATLASLADDASMKRVNFELSADQHTKLKIYATRQGKTIKELLTEYVASLPD